MSQSQHATPLLQTATKTVRIHWDGKALAPIAGNGTNRIALVDASFDITVSDKTWFEKLTFLCCGNYACKRLACVVCPNPYCNMAKCSEHAASAWVTHSLLWATRSLLWPTRSLLLVTLSLLWATLSLLWPTRPLLWLTRSLLLVTLSLLWVTLSLL
jgi:hypothetical protein